VRRKFAQDAWQRRKVCRITGVTGCPTITATACPTITATACPTIAAIAGPALTRLEEGGEVHVSNLALQHGIEHGRCGSSHEAYVRLLPPQGIEQFRLTPLQVSGVSLGQDVGNHRGTRGDFLLWQCLPWGSANRAHKGREDQVRKRWRVTANKSLHAWRDTNLEAAIGIRRA
jgi:hypothetical protein